MASRFATTSWTQVLAARGSASSESRQALEALCRDYWYPLYAFVRRQGFDAEESRDLTQAYFAQLLEKGYLEDFDPAMGRFRVFLMASMRNFLSKEREKAGAWKRGGRTEVLSLDDDRRDATATSRRTGSRRSSCTSGGGHSPCSSGCWRSSGASRTTRAGDASSSA